METAKKVNVNTQIEIGKMTKELAETLAKWDLVELYELIKELGFDASISEEEAERFAVLIISGLVAEFGLENLDEIRKFVDEFAEVAEIMERIDEEK